MKEVVVLAGAEAHVLGIYRRLEDAEEGLGDVFYADYLACCKRLARFPEISPRYYLNFRKLLLPKWHVGIFFSVEGLRVMVSAVMDLRQNPETIRRYLESI